MQVLEDKVISIGLSEISVALATELTTRVEKSAIVDRDFLFYWGHDETRRVVYDIDEHFPGSKLTFDIQSPMLRDYTWPGIYKPMDHQKETASFLSLRKRAFCFNEAGTGKTSAAIWAADYLMRLGLVKRVLVICPMSIMYTAWQGDIFKTAMHRSCGVAHGTADKRRKIINSEYEFVVINFDGVGVVRDEIKTANFDLIIIDEANAYKTSTTQRWKTLAKIITQDTWVWMMTGTPAAQSPVDAFGLAKVISPHRVPRFVTAWRDVTMRQISRFKWVPKNDSKDKVYSALQPAVRYTKKECLDLPPVTYQTREVPLTAQVVRYYKALKQQMRIEAAGEAVSAVNAASSLSKLLQISGGAVYTDKHDVIEFDISPRLNELKDAIDETSNKLIVFVPYLHTIVVVQEFLSSNGVTNEVINGDVTAANRAAIINRFQSQIEPKVLIIQPQSASHGVTLTAADTVVFWSPVMSVETYLQCVARIDRVGQTSHMTVIHLQGSDVERKVYAMLQGKVDSHQKLVDLYKQELEE